MFQFINGLPVEIINEVLWQMDDVFDLMQASKTCQLFQELILKRRILVITDMTNMHKSSFNPIATAVCHISLIDSQEHMDFFKSFSYIIYEHHGEVTFRQANKCVKFISQLESPMLRKFDIVMLGSFLKEFRIGRTAITGLPRAFLTTMLEKFNRDRKGASMKEFWPFLADEFDFFFLSSAVDNVHIHGPIVENGICTLIDLFYALAMANILDMVPEEPKTTFDGDYSSTEAARKIMCDVDDYGRSVNITTITECVPVEHIKFPVSDYPDIHISPPIINIEEDYKEKLEENRITRTITERSAVKLKTLTKKSCSNLQPMYFKRTNTNGAQNLGLDSPQAHFYHRSDIHRLPTRAIRSQFDCLNYIKFQQFTKLKQLSINIKTLSEGSDRVVSLDDCDIRNLEMLDIRCSEPSDKVRTGGLVKAKNYNTLGSLFSKIYPTMKKLRFLILKTENCHLIINDLFHSIHTDSLELISIENVGVRSFPKTSMRGFSEIKTLCISTLSSKHIMDGPFPDGDYNEADEFIHIPKRVKTLRIEDCEDLSLLKHFKNTSNVESLYIEFMNYEIASNIGKYSITPEQFPNLQKLSIHFSGPYGNEIPALSDHKFYKNESSHLEILKFPDLSISTNYPDITEQIVEHV